MYLRRLAASFALVVAATMVTGASPAAACSPDTDCEIGERTYRIAMPESEGSPGALLYAHGYRGSASGAMGNAALIRFAHENGLALVALKSFAEDWRIPGVPAEPGSDGAEELAYFDTLVPALAERHGIDTSRLVLTGFSAGGMATWFVACRRGEMFRAFVPIAGTFWAPVPDGGACPSYPVDLVHVHGTSDQIVPLGGRPIRTTHQGDIRVALERLAADGGYLAAAAVTPAAEGALGCEVRRNGEDRIMAFCTHPGGHSFKVGYLRAAFDILRDAGVLAAR